MKELRAEGAGGAIGGGAAGFDGAGGRSSRFGRLRPNPADGAPNPLGAAELGATGDGAVAIGALAATPTGNFKVTVVP